MTDLARDAWTVLRTEIRVRVRTVITDRRTLLGTASSLLLFGVLFPWFFRENVVSFGERAATGAVPLGPLGAAFATLAVVGVTVGASTGFGQETTGTVGPLVRTSVAPTAVSLARLASEVARGLTIFVLPAFAVLTFLGTGYGGPALPALLAAGALPVILAALLVGRLVGDAVRYLNLAVGVSLWVKAAVTVVVTLVFFVGTQALLFAGSADAGEGSESPLAAASLPPFLPGEPLQSYAGVVTSPGGGSPRAIGWAVGIVAVAAVPVALAAALRAETHLLFRETSAGDAGDAVAGTSGVPPPFTVGPGARVAWRYLLRTRRDPRILSHLMIVLFMGIGSLGNVVRDPGSIVHIGPPIAVIGGAVLAGATYCMNPLGDDVDQLPLLLTSAGSTSVLLHGRALAGVAVGLPLALGVGVPLAAVSESLLFAAWLAVLAVALVFGGAGVALGLGAVVPKFETREYMSVERPHPSNYVLFGYLLGATLVGGIGFLLVDRAASGAPGALVGVGWAVYLAVVGGAGLGGYVYAHRRFDDLSLDRF